MVRHVTQVQVRWADLDAYGHVNNVAFLRYLQEARVDLLFVQASRDGVSGLAEGVVVRRHDIDYLAPLQAGAHPLRVEIWIHEVRNATFTVGYELIDEHAPEPRVCARARTVLVPYNLDAGRPRRLSDDEQALLHRHLDADRLVPPAEPATMPLRDEPTKTHLYECAVRFDDLDRYGHVNNVTFAEYVQEARIDFARFRLFDVDGGPPHAVVGGQSLEYLAPVPVRSEPLHVYLWLTKIGDTSFHLAAEVADQHQVYVRAVNRLVAIDPSGQRARALVPAERQVLEQFLGGTT
ncbi:acyl-CoA thioesterase [Phytoactinopolyspora limicola]|uniref:acyl-CoA thioesterase n=1 Tax=Phytoactinopolyspora limicola TaxID=2715536 RepID=UPI001408AE4F|nr:thioesterase family protein [Phytoactinopolyspora limicola]